MKFYIYALEAKSKNLQINLYFNGITRGLFIITIITELITRVFTRKTYERLKRMLTAEFRSNRSNQKKHFYWFQ